jgi:hypothetical protein
VCGQGENWNDPFDKHHVFGGANRKNSEAEGLVVYLHHFSCHESGPNAVHRNRETDLKLKRAAERAWLKANEGTTVEDFMLIFGRNYI